MVARRRVVRRVFVQEVNVTKRFALIVTVSLAIAIRIMLRRCLLSSGAPMATARKHVVKIARVMAAIANKSMV